MATATVDVGTAKKAIAVMDEMIERQRDVVRTLALRVHPDLTDADLGNLRAFRDLDADPQLQLELARLESLLAARLTLRARLVGNSLAPTV